MFHETTKTNSGLMEFKQTITLNAGSSMLFHASHTNIKQQDDFVGYCNDKFVLLVTVKLM